MSNTIVSAIASNGAVSSIFTRAQIKAQISELKADCVHMLGAVSGTAARESFVKTCTAIAVQRAVFGSDEIYQTIAKKARTLPDYKVSKHGLVSGKLGKVLHAFGEAVSVGKALAINFPMAEEDCDMSVIARDITFGALIELPKPVVKAEATARAGAAAKAETTTNAETTGQESAPFNGNAATARNEEGHEAQWAAYGDALAYAMKQAREEASAPYFVTLFSTVAENNKDQALAMLEEMAALLGYKLSKAKTTVKKAA